MTNHLMIAALIVTGAIFLVILVIYCICNKKYDSVVISKPENRPDTVADMVYYLPAATVAVNATIKVIATQSNTDQSITSTKIQDISLDTTVAMVPDTSDPIYLNYIPNWFMNDEVRITTGPTGLLDCLTATSDDQVNNILKQVGDPNNLFKPAGFIVSDPIQLTGTSTVTTVILTYNKVFHLTQDQLIEKTINCPWVIFTDNTGSAASTVDASFSINFDHEPLAKLLPNKFKGLFTRPLTTLSFDITISGETNTQSNQVKWNILVPDVTRLISVPVKRSAFVKKVNAPKFSSGLLIENYFNQPSQFEGFISIPINILKSLLSIPAALFNLQIHHKYDDKLSEMALEQKLAGLQKTTTPPTGLNGGKVMGT